MFWPRLESFSAFSLKKAVVFSDTLHFCPAGCLELCSAAWGGEKEKQAGTQEWLGSAVRATDLPSHFPVSFQSDKNSDIHLPCLPPRASSFLFRCCTWAERGCALHTGSSQSHGHPCLSLMGEFPFLLPGVALGASWQAAPS